MFVMPRVDPTQASWLRDLATNIYRLSTEIQPAATQENDHPGSVLFHLNLATSDLQVMTFFHPELTQSPWAMRPPLEKTATRVYLFKADGRVSRSVRSELTSAGTTFTSPDTALVDLLAHLSEEFEKLSRQASRRRRSQHLLEETVKLLDFSRHR